MTISDAAHNAILTWQEEATLGYARDILRTQCLESGGFPQPKPYNRGEELNEKLFFDIGPWTEDMAATYGYQRPADSAEKEALIAGDDSPAESQRLVECGRKDPRLEATLHAVDELQLARDEVSYSDRNQQYLDRAMNDFRSCMTDEGYSFGGDDDTVIPAEAATSDREAELRVALDHAACAKKTSLAQTWVAVVSDQQGDYLEKNASAISTLRDKHADTLRAAGEIVKSSGK